MLNYTDIDFDDDFGVDGDFQDPEDYYRDIDQFDPYWTPYHIKGFMVLDDYYNNRTNNNVTGWH